MRARKVADRTEIYFSVDGDVFSLLAGQRVVAVAMGPEAFAEAVCAWARAAIRNLDATGKIEDHRAGVGCYGYTRQEAAERMRMLVKKGGGKPEDGSDEK